MSSFEINSIIYQGFIRKLNPSIEGFYHSKPNSIGLMVVTVGSYQCPRCEKSDGYVFENKKFNENSYFCGTPECVADDASYNRQKKDEQISPIFRR